MILRKVSFQSLAVFIVSVDSLDSGLDSEFRTKVTSEVLFASVSVGNDSDSIVIAYLESGAVLTNKIGFFMTCAHYRMAEAVEHIFSVLLRNNLLITSRYRKVHRRPRCWYLPVPGSADRGASALRRKRFLHRSPDLYRRRGSYSCFRSELM